MPKKKVNAVEEPEQTAAELAEQAGEEALAPPEEPPQDTNPPGDVLPPESGEAGNVAPIPGDAPGSEDGEGAPEEVMAMDVSGPPPEVGSEGGEPSDAVLPTNAQEIAGVLMEPLPPADEPVPAPPKSVPKGEASPARPRTDRQNFFAMDFREVDRDLTAEERQAWSSIYASFRGRSALSGTVIGADPHSMNVRSRETGRVERRTMYCVVVLLYRVPVYIPATEMWIDEARPDYVLQNMMGATIDFIITKVDREGGYAIASRRQAARTQRYFFAHRPDLCRTGARVKCRMLSVGPRRCLAECYGHDVSLTQRELRYTAS